jgi:AraC-like DNA-binding protein
MQMKASQTGDLQVFEHRSSLGQWRVAQRRADPRLRGYVHGFVVSEGYLPTAVREWHIPSLEVAVVLNFASPHRVLSASDPKRATNYRSGWVVGLQSRHRLTEAVGARDFIVIRFTPIGAHLVLKVPMGLLADRTIELEEIDGPWARMFESLVEATRGWEARLDLIELLIAERLTQARPPSFALNHCWQRILEAPNRDLALLSSESGCSRRHLIAQFHAHFGMPPKTIARIRRFNLAVGVVNRLGRNAVQHPPGKPYLDLEWDSQRAHKMDTPWAELALNCGYYDQSHFINEFRAFAGVTPVEFLRRMQLGD